MLAAPREQAWGRALGREHLDMMLRDAAVAAGAHAVSAGRSHGACSATADGTSVSLDDGREIAARIVIAACGSWNAKGAFAVPADEPRPSDLFAFKAHFTDSALPPGLMPLLAFPGGYGGMVESDGGRISLSCCIRRDVLAGARARHGGKAARRCWRISRKPPEARAGAGRCGAGGRLSFHRPDPSRHPRAP